MKHWNWSIGNLRAMSMEDNRSENNFKSPKTRLNSVETRYHSFILNEDWLYWSKIEDRLYDGNSDMIEAYLNAVINRICNIYEEWYSTLEIGKLFGPETSC